MPMIIINDFGNGLLCLYDFQSARIRHGAGFNQIGDGAADEADRRAEFAWADPRYDVVHASGVPCNQNLLAALRGQGRAETTSDDNLKTVRLVFAAYESAASGEAVRI